MNDSDKRDFSNLLDSVAQYYRVEISPPVKRIYWGALKKYDFQAIVDAFGRHAANPDTGTFAPKAADIIRMIDGNTKDSGMRAWAKVERAIRTVGAYRTVAFDDSLIHKVISDMGGWIKLCGTESDALPFVSKEFIERYRGFAVKSERPEYPRKLIGLADADRQARGMHLDRVALIGAQEAAKAVLAGGSDAPALAYTEHKADSLPGGSKAIEHKVPLLPSADGLPGKVGDLAKRIQDMAKKST